MAILPLPLIGAGVKYVADKIRGPIKNEEQDAAVEKARSEGGDTYQHFDTSGAETVFNPYGEKRLGDDKSYVRGLKDQKWGQQNQGMFDNNLGRMRDTMNGVGPSHGVNSLQAANQRTNAGLFSGAASARGAGGLGMASMNAANRSAANNQRAGNESEMIRAMEADAARKGMFNAINQNRADTIAGESARYGAMNDLGGDIDERTRFGANVDMAKDEWLRNRGNMGRGKEDTFRENRATGEAIKEKATRDQQDSITSGAIGFGGKVIESVFTPWKK